MEAVLQKVITIDVETSGLPPEDWDYHADYMQSPYILSMAWKINDGQTYEYIVNQEGRSIPPSATAINGITMEMCEESKFTLFSTLVQFIMDCNQNDLVIGHHVYFDTSIIKANALRIVHGGKTPMAFYDQISAILDKEKRVDTCRASMGLNNGKRMRLEQLHSLLFNKMPDKSHGAGADVDTCYACYVELIKLGKIKVKI